MTTVAYVTANSGTQATHMASKTSTAATYPTSSGTQAQMSKSSTADADVTNSGARSSTAITDTNARDPLTVTVTASSLDASVGSFYPRVGHQGTLHNDYHSELIFEPAEASKRDVATTARGASI